MPRLLVEKGPDRGKAVSVATGQQVVAGRDKAADLQLSDNMASRRHFLIASKGSIFGLKDLQSANGTLVNGRKAEGAHKLQFGDSIQVGETLLSWLPDEQTDKKGGLIGHAVGGYRIEERLGRGAMGTVYKATQLSLGRTVALKVLSQDLVKDEKFCEMFVKEARAAGGLNHPNIIQVYDVGDEDGNYFFSMEYAAKGSVLEELQAVRQFPLPRAVKIIRDACSALDYAERKGLVHRDIKPDNLMVMEDSTVKLGDLGLAMSTVELQAEQDGVFGTPHYIAPEQAMGKPIDHRADIYALGATLYRMLSGKTMFTGSTVKEILKKQVREQHPPITDWVPDCPEGIKRIIDRMLIKNPAERYQHASEISSDLADFENLSARKSASDGSAFANRVTALSPDQSQRIAEQKSRRSIAIAGIAAAAAVLAAAISIGFVLFGGSDPLENNNSDPISGVNSSSNTPPSNSDPTQSPEMVAANKKVEERINIARYLLENPPGRPEELDKDIERIDQVLKEQKTKASPDLLKQLQDLRDKIWAKRMEMLEGFATAQTQYDDAWREVMALIEDFKFEGAKEPVAAFVTKWKDSKDEKITQLVKQFEDFLQATYKTRCDAVLREFVQRMEREEREADKLEILLRVATIDGIAKRVRETEETCDESNGKKRLGELAGRLEKKAKDLRSEADREERLRLDEAAKRSGEKLNAALNASRQNVANGNFKAANDAMDNFKLSDPDFITYGSSERFKALRDDIQLRIDQNRLIFESLQILAASLPALTKQKTGILKATPWPADVAALLGGGDTPIIIVVEGAVQDVQWKLQAVAGSEIKSISAGEFNTRTKRLVLAQAIEHLFKADDGFKQQLLKATPAGPPAILGVFAWMMDMEAYEPSFPIMEYAWAGKIPVGNRFHPLLREYYAWYLLARADMAGLAGDQRTANDLIRRLDSEFKDTRAAKGRK